MNLLPVKVLADAATKQKRREICLKCPNVRGVRMPVCGVCMCPIITKTALSASQCPLPTPKW